jgi:hypothetical protein
MEFLSRKTVRLPRWAIFVSPGRIHLTGRHVGDIAAERDGDVPGRGGGLAEVDGDVLGDDDPVQHPRHTGEDGGRAAAAVAGEEAVGRDDDGGVEGVPHLLGVGYHLGLGQRHLPGEDLHAQDADGAVAGFGGHKAADRVGGLRGVVLVQRESTGWGGKGDIVGVAFGVGQAGGGEAVAADGNGHALHGGRLACRKGLDAESSGVFHGDTLLCW